MARIDSKQLNQRFTGSFTLSGSFLGDNSSTASFGKLSLPGVADVSQSLSSAVSGNDNLGNHRATQDLNLNSNAIKNVTHISASGNISGSITSTGSFGMISATSMSLGGGIFTSASIAAGGSGVSSYTDLTNVPSGIISGSGQLPSGIISGSGQLPSGIISGSSQIASDISGSFNKGFEFDGKISGSSTSTGSFGRVEVDGKLSIAGIADVSASISAAGNSGGSGGGSGTGIFAQTGSIMSTTNDLQISGSIKISGSKQSTSIFANNIQNGYPTSNNWKENLDGSFFNNFDNTTHVSEILRFMAGAISHSLNVADAAPNTKTYGSVTATHNDGSETSKSSLLNGVLGSTYENARLSSAWTGSAFIDMSETGSYKLALDYLEAKGWVQSSDRGTNDDDVGTNPFHGTYASRIPSSNITTQATFGTFSHTLAANAAGSTAVSSNSNFFGLGGLNSGAANTFKVRVIASQSFSDNYSDQTPDGNSTFSTSSIVDYTTTSFGTSGDGLSLGKIITSQPAVIPSAFQDGDFSVAGALSGRRYTGGATSATNISASGYYAYHGIRAGIASGSQTNFTFQNGSDSSTRFYLYTGGITTDITDSQPTCVVTSSLTRTGFTATSRSLSGAPYLLTTTYAFKWESEVTKSFDPAFGYSTNVLVNSNPTDQWENIGSTTISNTTTTVANTGVTSTGATNYVIDSTHTTKRSSGDKPNISDIAVASSSFSFSLDSNSDNIFQNRSTQAAKNYNLKFRAQGVNWKGTSRNETTSNIQFYDATLFNQSSTSGSMAIYSRAQGYDANTLQDTTETFTGESFRIQLNNNVTSFNGQYIPTESFRTRDAGNYSNDTSVYMGAYSLQVKPGYLVNPLGDYGYWFSTDSLSGGNTGYRFYIRRFQKSSGTKTSMTVNLSSKTLVAWNATDNDSIACALILKSGTSSGTNTSITTCRLFDPSATVSNLIEAGVSADNFKNPFTSDIDLYGNTGGSVSSGTYTVPIRNADGMFLDDSDDELYVVVRYKGDPAPIQQITLSYS